MDDTFIFLYIMYKLGCAGLVVALLMLIAAVIQLVAQCGISIGSDTFPLRITVTILLALFGLVVGMVTPHYKEIKAWVYYTVTENTADKEKAKKLIQTAFDYLDGKEK